MKLFFITILAPVFVLAFPSNDDSPFKNAEFIIKRINSDPHSTWKAGHNFDPNLPKSYVQVLLGVIEQSDNHSLPLGKSITDIDDEAIPKSFDARNKWKNCKSLHQIRDQGNCGSCWAVAVASAFTDRLCIATNGKFNNHLSVEELLACCPDCGHGCGGGIPVKAWQYLVKHGIVTGGDYHSEEGCQPYSVQPCEHHVKGPRPSCPSFGKMVTPACHKKCTNKKYTKPFKSDHKKASAYSVKSIESAIQKEILKYGPVASIFDVYDDFFTYKKGVYQHSPGRIVGRHVVKVIGWGVEKGVKYWLVQNSWNTDWGDKGLFKILRGKNESKFESQITSGLPVV